MFEEENQLTEKIIGAAIEVHKALGPGLLESAYRACSVFELRQQGIHVDNELELPVVYKGVQVDCGYRIDVMVEKKVIVELKSVDELAPIHEAQLMSYMKLSNVKVGLLMNVNVTQLTKGIRRRVL
jgi:GxxExxY protein